jgi:hypothetical protein
VLRAAQAARLVGAVQYGDRAVGPHDTPLRAHVARPLGGRRDRQDAAVALDHDVARILGGRPDQRDAAGALLDPRPDIFGAGPGLAETAPREERPHPPIARRRQLARPRPLAPHVIDFGELVGARILYDAAAVRFGQRCQRGDQRRGGNAAIPFRRRHASPLNLHIGREDSDDGSLLPLRPRGRRGSG